LPPHPEPLSPGGGEGSDRCQLSVVSWAGWVSGQDGVDDVAVVDVQSFPAWNFKLP
jgi:hypothetical protein